MTDAQTILAAAGVSVPEVKEYIARCTWLAENDEMCDSAESIEASADVMALALAREVGKRDRALDFLLGSQRAVDLYYVVPEARLGDPDDAKRILLAQFAKEASE